MNVSVWSEKTLNQYDLKMEMNRLSQSNAYDTYSSVQNLHNDFHTSLSPD